jgi:hypothetical protein
VCGGVPDSSQRGWMDGQVHPPLSFYRRSNDGVGSTMLRPLSSCFYNGDVGSNQSMSWLLCMLCMHVRGLASDM